MYKNIRIIKIKDKIDAFEAMKSIVVTLDRDLIMNVLDKGPGVIMRGVFTPHAKKIKEALERVGTQVELE